MKLFFDFLPVVLFFIAYKAFDIYVATAVAIGTSALQTLAYRIRMGRFERMHLVVLGLLVVLGGATLLLRDPLFIKWKPTLVNWAFAVVFLGSEFLRGPNLIQRMLGAQLTLPAPVWRRLNIGWVLFFLLTGAANIYVAYTFDEATWVNFKLFGLLGLTLVFVLLQGVYLSRHLPDDEQGPSDSNRS